MGRRCRLQCAQLALPRLVALALQAALHEQRRLAGAMRQEVHLEAFGGADVGDIVGAPFQLEQQGSLERSTVVFPAAALEERDQPGIYRSEERRVGTEWRCREATYH